MAHYKLRLPGFGYEIGYWIAYEIWTGSLYGAESNERLKNVVG